MDVICEACSRRGRGQYESKSSLRHMGRAWALKETMPEVAVFLAITAEEEAAAAIFKALLAKGYIGSSTLSRKRHPDKAGVSIFLRLLGEPLLKPLLDVGVKLDLFFQKCGDENRLKLQKKIPIEGMGFLPLVLDEPLCQVLVEKGGGSPDFSRKVKEVASNNNIEVIKKHIQKVANERNFQLYSNGSSVPVEKSVDAKLEYYKSNSLLNLTVYILLCQSKSFSLVQELLSAYVAVLKDDG